MLKARRVAICGMKYQFHQTRWETLNANLPYQRCISPLFSLSLSLFLYLTIFLSFLVSLFSLFPHVLRLTLSSIYPSYSTLRLTIYKTTFPYTDSHRL